VDAYTGWTVYIVDDDAAVRDSMRVLLETYGLTVRDYASARAFLSDRPSVEKSCLLLDLHMPEMSGLELVDWLQQDGLDIPTIIVTGRGDASTRARALAAGALALLNKPVEETELLHSLKTAWSEGRTIQ
jgi:two-component system response regulator FixJ